jgi:hypothetical protein
LTEEIELINARQQRHYDPVAGTSTTEATGTGTATNVRPTSSKIKESASGVKGLAAAIHGAGEAIRGNFNAGVDRAFNDVCVPIIFPPLKTTAARAATMRAYSLMHEH